MGDLNSIFDCNRFPPISREDLPSDKVNWRFRLQKFIDMGGLQRDLDMVSARWPDEYLSEPKVDNDRDDISVIVITGYPPRHNYDVQRVLNLVYKHDPTATLVI
ncbi:uncharacterized protein [Physcomitrium patens]|uniref:Uncharacterized protein n=2 Tax=Physcomitrium patens TaxID=3218 RepID=A0A7I4ESB5_PHYPA|nr:uncharacterized protein LOC112286762 [Physcomitrium patens]|eukprot:XP_024384776.1 uncharacterized protein LOC112286762 [Physcomitrella patens]